ncbi:plasmid replication initiator TrfA [Burkholderia gladioli]|uniref:plasmid replication initiator TrfA n=2 Tax=Burkholderia gladioli TaxID=28095 RepID=UPI00163E9A8F|nr:plasmid replication initiator TrfA [Burkholderia gladioli]
MLSDFERAQVRESVQERARLMEEKNVTNGQLRLFPGWGNDTRGMSKSLARSALFAVRDKRAERERYDNAVIASIEGLEIRYSGEELRQDDHDVFMQLCHLARDEHIGEAVHISGLQALEGLKWGRSQEDYDRLRACYKRLLEGTIYVTKTDADRAGKVKRKTQMFGSHLFTSVAAEVEGDSIESLSARWTIKLNKELARIMNGNEMTLIRWAADKKLTPLAKWLHRFYATHEKPYDMKAETLHKLCGSRQASMAAFRQKLKGALQELQDAGLIKSFSMGPKPSYLVRVVNAGLAKMEAAEAA